MTSFKIVAAIDIGTPFSTYAYSTTESFKKDPLDVHQKRTWYSDSRRKGITKTATCLLLDKNQRFVSFGNDAQQQFADFKRLRKSNEYLFFRNFNLQLYESKEPFVRLQLYDCDRLGRAAAKRVYAIAIRALKNEVLQQFETDERLINETDIRWIVSTNVAYPEDSRFFMKECAKQAGIQAHQVFILHEPEAATIYMHYLNKQNKDDTVKSTKQTPIRDKMHDGEKYRHILVKIAGKSIELTVLERSDNGEWNISEKEKSANSDTMCGFLNDLVDIEFWKILIQIFGQPFLTKIQEEKPISYMMIFKHLNEIKTANSSRPTTWFPVKMWNDLFTSYSDESMEDAISESRYYSEVNVFHKEDRLQISQAMLKSCFSSTVDCLISLLETVFKKERSNNVKDVIIVGDLAESRIIKTEIQKRFPAKNIFVPELANLAIVKGAVMFGHAPEILGKTMNRKCLPINKHLAVVAIDFGTANSGYAFSTINTYKECPLNISLMKTKKHTNSKTSTSVLLDESKRFVKFGGEAQDEYAKIQLLDKKDTYYYFENFKMMLYNSNVPLRERHLMDIQENRNKTVLAQDVFASAIQALKEKAIDDMERNGTPASEEEIRWVLTVPAIWPDDAKLFMRESASQAGIPPERLLIALEPEVASIYVQWMETDKANSGGYNIAATGTKYLVADIGGGTTDITVHEKLQSGLIKEINKASGEGCGGRSVDAAFFNKLDDIFGKTIMERLRTEKPKALLELHRAFEDVKRRFGNENKSDDAIKFPFQIIDKWLEVKDEADRLAKRKGFDVRDGKLILPDSKLTELFRPTVQAIVTKIEDALRFNNSNEVSIIMLVGGFSKNNFLRNEIQKQFRSKRIITPADGNLAVLKGAVLYGHKPESIDQRITRFTYGVETTMPFDSEIHDEHRKFIDQFGRARCRGVFSMIIHANKTVKLGTTIKRKYTIPSKVDEIEIMFFASDKDLPLYTNEDGCRKIGTLTVCIPRPSNEEREVEVEFIFGNTEINIRAVDTRYRKEAVTILSFE